MCALGKGEEEIIEDIPKDFCLSLRQVLTLVNVRDEKRKVTLGARQEVSLHGEGALGKSCCV